MKNIQKKISYLLDEMYKPHSQAHGYIKKRSVRTNAMQHLKKKNILQVDIESFFDAITFPRIRGRLLAPPYNLTNDTATTVAKLCTLNGALPMGSPASPTISNIICAKMDYQLAEFASKNGCFYSRYADDLTFSTNRNRFPKSMVEFPNNAVSGTATIGKALENIITSNGFQVNASKTRVASKHDSQEICGIICNEKLNVRRKQIRQIRAMLHAWRKFGKQAAEAEWSAKYNWRKANSFEASIRGKIQYLISIRGPQDAVVFAYVQQYNSLVEKLLKDIVYQYDDGWSGLINSAVCIVEGHDDEHQHWSQGTGFIIENGIIVTNSHTLENGDANYPVIKVKFQDKPLIDFEAEIVEQNAEKDVATIRLKDSTWAAALTGISLELSYENVTKGEAIWLCGFPTYHLGDDCSVVNGIVVGHHAGKQERFRISQTIVKGNSGGPVINEKGKVIGIAVTGVSAGEASNIIHNGVILLKSVKSIIDKTLTSVANNS